MGPLTLLATMKTEPTDLDREAARLFSPAPGMRTWQAAGARTIGPRRVIEVDASGATGVDIRTEGGWSRLPVCALDTDDPPTVGAMLAQVEQSRPGFAVSIIDRLATLPDEPDRRFDVLVLNADGVQEMVTGPTRGAALVAAMRAFKGRK